MRAYGHVAMKRTLFWSNSYAVYDLTVAKVCAKEYQSAPCTHVTYIVIVPVGSYPNPFLGYFVLRLGSVV